MKDDWRVLRRERGPGGAVTTECAGWSGRKAPSRYCWHLRERLVWSSNTEASVWRWSTQVILSPPVAMRRAAFWMTCSFFSAVSEVFGNQAGHA